VPTANRLGYVVVGGLIGSTIRYLITRSADGVPWEVLVVNVCGAVLAGVLVGRIGRHAHESRVVIPFAVIGVAGALTTFSGFVVDTVLLADAGLTADAIRYATVSIVLGPLAAGLGLKLGSVS